MGQLHEEWVREGSVGGENSMGKGPGVGRAWYPLRTEEKPEWLNRWEPGRWMWTQWGSITWGARKRSEFFLLNAGARRSLDSF